LDLLKLALFPSFDLLDLLFHHAPMIGTNGLLALGSLVATLATATPFELGARQDSGGGAPGVTLARPTTNNWVLNVS